MHKVKVLTIGSDNFNTSLEELKDFLSFDLYNKLDDLTEDKLNNYDVLLIHEPFLKRNSIYKEILNKGKNINILLSESKNQNLEFFHEQLPLPTSIDDINKAVENAVARKSFNKNSSIKIKNYTLDKNERKLFKEKKHILLTEKEIQLLELLLAKKGAINKDKILKEVWGYSDETDTHTVETHVYRLRKKIKKTFLDENFILNKKEGYSL
tara:strand:+ start:150 stop:779 length:630 start_codon:yes stop_codon:yes gene_type:complete